MPEGRAQVIADEPVARMGKPDDIAAAVMFVATNDTR
jgi:NAD(P)-dependent dehydrogenase (short-subunit alcohol dehydrogenase family)